MNARNGHDLEYFIKRMYTIPRILWRLYIINIFPDADGVGLILNKYNPFSYLLFAVLFVLVLLIEGISGIKREWKENKLGFGYNQYWKNNKERIELISRFKRANK